MPLAWIEDGDSRSATIARLGRKAQSSYRKSYKVFGTTDDTVVHAEANTRITSALAYWQYPGVPGMQLRAESYSVSYLGDDAWQVQIDYVKDGSEGGEEPLKRARSFDTTGGTQHITQAAGGTVTVTGTTIVTQSSEARYPPGTAPSMSNAIGVTEAGVQGVDIVVPQMQWQESYDVPNAYVTPSYIRTVAALTGTINAATFRGFQPGEVLFLGCSGSHEWDDQRGIGPWSLSYRFVASPNVTNQTIGDITGIAKDGHDYLWVVYESASSNGSLVKRPKFVYVNRVYKRANFSLLGLGTA